jgi:hypothetical protein
MWTDSTQPALAVTPDGSAGARERDLVVGVARTDGVTVGVVIV